MAYIEYMDWMSGAVQEKGCLRKVIELIHSHLSKTAAASFQLQSI